MKLEGGKIFICYARKDKGLMNMLSDSLRVFETRREISVWVDRHIEPGSRWEKEIKAKIQRANVALLLISNNFFQSKFIQETELPFILERYELRNLKVIPVLLSGFDEKFKIQLNNILKSSCLVTGAKYLSLNQDGCFRENSKEIIEIIRPMF